MTVSSRATLLILGVLLCVSVGATTVNTVNLTPNGSNSLSLDHNVDANVLRFLTPIPNPNCASGDVLTGSGGQQYCMDTGGDVGSTPTLTTTLLSNGGLAGFIDVYDKNPGGNMVGLLLQATFNPANMGTFTGANSWNGSFGNNAPDFDVLRAGLEGPGRRPLGSSVTVAATPDYNEAYFVYFYLNLSQYNNNPTNRVPGLPGVYAPTGTDTTLNIREAVRIPFSFNTLPADVVFNVYGVRTCTGNTTTCIGGLQVAYGNPNSSEVRIGRCTTCTYVPEPTSMILLGSGLAGLVLRRRRSA